MSAHLATRKLEKKATSSLATNAEELCRIQTKGTQSKLYSTNTMNNWFTHNYLIQWITDLFNKYRFKVHAAISDSTGHTEIILFDRDVRTLLGKTVLSLEKEVNFTCSFLKDISKSWTTLLGDQWGIYAGWIFPANDQNHTGPRLYSQDSDNKGKYRRTRQSVRSQWNLSGLGNETRISRGTTTNAYTYNFNSSGNCHFQVF